MFFSVIVDVHFIATGNFERYRDPGRVFRCLPRFLLVQFAETSLQKLKKPIQTNIGPIKKMILIYGKMRNSITKKVATSHLFFAFSK